MFTKGFVRPFESFGRRFKGFVSPSEAFVRKIYSLFKFRKWKFSLYKGFILTTEIKS